jgi:hypothetical protein
MRVCATLGSAGTRFREKKIYILKEKSHSLYISRMHGGAPIQPVAMEVCTFVKVPNVMKRANFGGCM